MHIFSEFFRTMPGFWRGHDGTFITPATVFAMVKSRFRQVLDFKPCCQALGHVPHSNQMIPIARFFRGMAFIWRSHDGTFIAPAKSLTTLKGRQCQSLYFKPFCQTFAHTIQRNPMISAFISSLQWRKKPSAVRLGVRAIIIDTLNGMLGAWSRTHFREKRSERGLPFWTYLDATSAIIRISLKGGIATTPLHAVPNPPFWCVTHAMRTTQISSDAQTVTSAACRITSAQGLANYKTPSPTGTQTPPSHLALGTVWSTGFNGPIAKGWKLSQINQAAHHASYSGVEWGVGLLTGIGHQDKGLRNPPDVCSITEKETR